MLLTADDVTRRSHYRNAHRTFAKLLELGVLPIVNENDTVATSEIRFGDNDRLAALVAHLVHADLLVLLSDVDGLYDGHPAAEGSRLIADVALTDDLARRPDRRAPARPGSAPAACAPSSTPPGSRPAPASRRCSPRPTRPGEALAAEPVGTWFHAATGAARPASCGWPTPPSRRACCSSTTGAVRAVTERRASLLPAGLTGVTGTFVAGDPVDLAGPEASRSPAGWSTSTPTRSRGWSGAPRPPSAASSGRRTSARSSTATTSPCARL